MAFARPGTEATPHVGLPGALLAVALGAFALTTDVPGVLALVIAGAGAAAALTIRIFTAGRRTDLATIVVLVTIGVLGAAAPDSRAAALAGGIAVLALLAWLADDPGRVEGGARRAWPAIGVTGLAFGGAWVSSYLFPAAATSIGVIAGLLVIVILLATTLLARPTWIEGEPSA